MHSAKQQTAGFAGVSEMELLGSLGFNSAIYELMAFLMRWTRPMTTFAVLLALAATLVSIPSIAQGQLFGIEGMTRIPNLGPIPIEHFQLIVRGAKELNVPFGLPVQEIQAGRAARAATEEAVQDDEKKQEAEKESQEPMVEATKVERSQLGPRQVRLHLWDGSIVMGDVSIDSIHVETRFGKLEVPIANIQEFRPGLNSVPEINDAIVGLVEKLGDREFQVRESARQSLAAMGPMIRNRLQEFADDGSAERKKHLATLNEEFTQLVEDGTDNGETIEPPIDIEDTITTGEFTIVGKIVEKQFQLSTRYGQLNLDLQHIKRADRVWDVGKDAVRKAVDVAGDQFFQKTPMATRILVKAGDRVSIRASGSVAWVSWGNISSGPDGIGQQGEWNGAQCGTLMARIGKSGEYIKVGSKGDFVAKSSGELFLGVAMQDHLATQEGYQWSGKYRTKIVVESGAEQP